MFGRRKDVSKGKVSLFTYYIDLNVQRISEWIGSDSEIGCEAPWKVKDSNVVRHIIDYLPKAGVHFHRTPCVFSEMVAGVYRTRGGDDIEWGIEGERFIVSLPIVDKALFYCPILRARQMLSSGHNNTSNLRGESNLIEIQLEDNHQHATCRRVLQTTWSTYNLMYSNDLVKVVFETAPNNNVIYYHSYLNQE